MKEKKRELSRFFFVFFIIFIGEANDGTYIKTNYPLLFSFLFVSFPSLSLSLWPVYSQFPGTFYVKNPAILQPEKKQNKKPTISLKFFFPLSMIGSLVLFSPIFFFFFCSSLPPVHLIYVENIPPPPDWLMTWPIVFAMNDARKLRCFTFFIISFLPLWPIYLLFLFFFFGHTPTFYPPYPPNIKKT